MDPITTTTSLASPQTTTSLQDLSAAAAAIALEMKPKMDLSQPTPKIKKLVRRNASDKLKLIRMVHDNPILWDSRLPNFKGAEEEKNRAWEQIGKEFNAPGRRVARAFKSLRESYRRELAHVKLMGNGFKPKWSLYEPMDFLREVIRERKGGSHSAEHTSLGLNLNAYMQHLTNNNNNNTSNHNHHKAGFSKVYSPALAASFNKSALDLSKCSSLNINQDDYYLFVKSEYEASSHSNGGSASGSGSGSASGCPGGTSSPNNIVANVQQPLPAHQHHNQYSLQHLNNTHNDSRVSSTRHDASQISSFDDMDASSLRSEDETSARNVASSHQGSDEVEELDAIDADFPYPLILDSNSPNSGVNNRNSLIVAKRRRKNNQNGNNESPNGGDDEDEEEEDDYDDQMLQQHRHLSQQQHLMNGNNGLGLGGNNILGINGGIDMTPPQTVREVLNSKFCGFISAKLNSMEDSEADNLMNKILMLLVQTQSNDVK